MQQPDLESRADIELLIRSFYEKVQQDVTIGYHFKDVDWPNHLPRMYDFWENIVFQTGNFSGNPMTTHMQLHQRSPLTPAHFQQWLKLFTSTADELFAGPNTELIKQRAISIGTIMQAKMS